MKERRVLLRVHADIDLLKLVGWVNDLLQDLSPAIQTDVDILKIENVWIAKVYG